LPTSSPCGTSVTASVVLPPDTGKRSITYKFKLTAVGQRITHAGQRGSNENTNGLLRQYLPKGTDLSTLLGREATMNDSHSGSSQRMPSATVHRIGSSPIVEVPPPSPMTGDQMDFTEETLVANDRLVFTVAEAAYLINVSRAFAYELVARGELPSIRLGRRIVIPRIGLQKLLDLELG
jgi:excisionase family DNA binding protein